MKVDMYDTMRKKNYIRNFFCWLLKCTIRWTKRTTLECYLSCGMEYFCWKNGFKVWDVIYL